MNKSLLLNMIKQHYGFKTHAEFAKFLGVTPQALSNWYSRETYDIEILYTKCLDLNPEWIITGKGEMLKEKNVPTKMVPEGATGGIPLIPLSAFAGAANGDITVLEYECERYIVPLFHDAEFLISIKGSSMSPKYHSGDIIACKKLALSNMFFQWNKVYVIDTDQGVIVKRIKKSQKEDSFLMVSENVLYEPFELHVSQIRALAIVIGVIRLE